MISAKELYATLDRDTEFEDLRPAQVVFWERSAAELNERFEAKLKDSQNTIEKLTLVRDRAKDLYMDEYRKNQDLQVKILDLENQVETLQSVIGMSKPSTPVESETEYKARIVREALLSSTLADLDRDAARAAVFDAIKAAPEYVDPVEKLAKEFSEIFQAPNREKYSDYTRIKLVAARAIELGAKVK